MSENTAINMPETDFGRFRYCVFGPTWSPHYDRYLPTDDRYKPNVLEIIETAGRIKGLDGIEFVHPQQVVPENVQELRMAVGEADLVTAAVAVSISSKRQYRAGALSSDDPQTRRIAINTVKTGMDLTAEMGSDRIFLWLGRDGFDYPFQIDYDLYWGRIVEALREIAQHRPEIKIAINYKIKEPRRWLLASTAAKTMLLSQEVGLPNLGAMIDFGHSMMAYENPAESIAMLARRERLFHTHLNDNTRLWDDDMVIGSLHFFETLEMLYWLERVDYQGWISFDPHAQNEDPTRMVEESLRYVKGMARILQRAGRQAVEAAIRSRQVTEIMALVGEQIFS